MKSRILLVDDEWEFTSLLKKRLESVGYYRVQEENNPKAAAQAAREFMPDLIVMDVMMPYLDGAEVAATIREDHRFRHVPILFVTSLVSGDHRVDGEYSGKRKYLPKSLTLGRLIDQIEENLKLAHRASSPDAPPPRLAAV